jgi:hypothetical protein
LSKGEREARLRFEAPCSECPPSLDGTDKAYTTCQSKELRLTDRFSRLTEPSLIGCLVWSSRSATFHRPPECIALPPGNFYRLSDLGEGVAAWQKGSEGVSEPNSGGESRLCLLVLRLLVSHSLLSVGRHLWLHFIIASFSGHPSHAPEGGRKTAEFRIRGHRRSRAHARISCDSPKSAKADGLNGWIRTLGAARAHLGGIRREFSQ